MDWSCSLTIEKNLSKVHCFYISMEDKIKMSSVSKKKVLSVHIEGLTPKKHSLQKLFGRYLIFTHKMT